MCANFFSFASILLCNKLLGFIKTHVELGELLSWLPGDTMHVGGIRCSRLHLSVVLIQTNKK